MSAQAVGGTVYWPAALRLQTRVITAASPSFISFQPLSPCPRRKVARPAFAGLTMTKQVGESSHLTITCCQDSALDHFKRHLLGCASGCLFPFCKQRRVVPRDVGFGLNP